MTKGSDTLTPMRRRAVDRLLIQYLELSEREQPAWLEQTRKRFPRLGHWLAQLIDDSHTVTLLNESVRRVAGESVDRMEVSVTRLAEGDRLGPWQVIEEIGEGGMGRVYHGQRADGAFEMDVAIKQIGQRRRGLAELLQRECRLLAKLDHPSVTRLVDAGLDDRAGPFLVMEWIEGTDLSDWLEKGSPDLATRLNLFEQVAEAVAHAHQRLIVHGDIKPNNIRIRDNGTVKLMDFGVARLLEAEDSQDAALRALTPAFAAPEQLSRGSLTAQSDVWSLGALLVWLLTGTPPRQVKPGSISRHLAVAAPRPIELAAIADRACAESPAQRYGSVRDLIDDLKRYGRNEPTEAAPVSVPGRLWKFARRNRVAVAAALVFAGLLLGASVVSTVLYLQAENERQRAEQSAETARTVMEVQQSLLADMEPSQLAQGLVAGLRGAIQEGPDSAHRLAVFNRIMDQADATGLMRELLVNQVIKPAETEMMARLAGDSLDLAALQDSLGGVYMRWGLYEQAVAQFQLASDRYRSLRPDDDPEYYASTVRLFSALASAGDVQEAMELATEVVDSARDRLGARNLVTMEAEHAYATLLLMTGQFGSGMPLLESLVERRLEVLGPEQPETLLSMHNQATGLLMTGQVEAARPLLENVVEARIRVHGPSHSLTLTSRSNLASALVELGELDQGLEMMEQVAELQAEALGRHHSSYLLTSSNIALLLRRVGRIEQGLELESALVETHRETLGDAHLETLRVRLNRAITRRELGDIDAAYVEFGEVAGMREEILGPDNPAALNARVYEADARSRLGQADQAAEDLRALGERLDASAGPLHTYSLTAQTYLAKALDELGRRDEAIERIEDRLRMMDEQAVADNDSDRAELLALLDDFQNASTEAN